MGHLQIKNMPPELHEALRQRAETERMTMSDYVVDVLRRDLAAPTMRAWLERLHTREPVLLDGGAADTVRQAREEREEELATRPDRR